MGSLLNIIMITLCMNTFFYFGMNYMVVDGVYGNKIIGIPGDFFSVVLDDNAALDSDVSVYLNNFNSSTNITNQYSYRLANNLTTPPNAEAGQPSNPTQGSFSFFDSIRIIFSIIPTLFSIVLVPLLLFTQTKIPVIISIMLALPLSLCGLFLILAFIRGSSI